MNSSLIKLETCLRWGLKWGMVVGFSTAAFLYLIQFLLRLFFQYSISQIDWGIQYGFVMSALLGAAYAVKKNENIKIELFRRLSKKKWVQLTNGFLAVLVTSLILWVFYDYTLNTVRNTVKGGVKNFLITLPYFYLFFASLTSYIVRITDVMKNA